MDRKAVRTLAALVLTAAFAFSGCVSSSAKKGSWVATNPVSADIKYALQIAKDSLVLTATDTKDGSKVGNLKIQIKESDEKTGRMSGPILSSDGVYEDLKGTAFVRMQTVETATEGSILYLAVSDVSYEDFEIQLSYAKQ